MYVAQLFPWIENSDFIRNHDESRVDTNGIYCPVDLENVKMVEDVGDIKKCPRMLKAYHVFPCDVLVLDEKEDIVKKVVSGEFGTAVPLTITDVDYSPVARRIDVETYGDKLMAVMQCGGGFARAEIASDLFIMSASNGTPTMMDMASTIRIPFSSSVSMLEFMNSNVLPDIQEAVSDTVRAAAAKRRQLGNDISKMYKFDSKTGAESAKSKHDTIYQWLEAYFALPEGKDLQAGGREVVPLLIGPTAVFKSATVKELCKKYNFRMVDFRVSFTSRLDYTGLYQIGDLDGDKYSYSCPMEELVTCSDGFREYCTRAYDKIKQILSRGYLEEDAVSDGNDVVADKVPLDPDQKVKLEKLLEQYAEYKKTCVLFFDEITRCKDNGVNGILVQLLNQKRFNNMTLNKCKFVAATNLDLKDSFKAGNRNYEDYSDKLEDLYDVSTELDAAYSNRFMPIQVTPEKVQDRWFEWAEGDKPGQQTEPDQVDPATGQVISGGKPKSNIHPMILEFFKSGKVTVGKGTKFEDTMDARELVYNNTPVMIAIDEDKSDNEIKAETFPNYRTWDLLSNYMYSIDSDYEYRLKSDPDAKKEYRGSVIDGLISSWAGIAYRRFLDQNGYIDFEIGKNSSKESIEKYPEYDDVGDFLNSSLDAGTPALLIGPSSMGKTSRIKAYMKRVEKRTGLKPVYIEVNLAAMNADTLMGMPVKQKLTDYVAGGDLSESGLGSVGRELSGIMKGITEDLSFGLTDSLTRRAPDMTIKERFKKALDEGREVIINFDECNRCKSSTVMSAIFECISDQKIFGISFKEQKDKVKIVAACNMSYAGMDDEEDMQDYSAAGSIDPALAARFAVKWKKRYDERDVRSWLQFMKSEAEEGHVDPVVADFFDDYIETNGMEAAVKVIKSVEKRTIESAQPSTRMLLQLSKEIKEMSDPSTALFKGMVFFTEQTNDKFNVIFDACSTDKFYSDPLKAAQDIITFARKILKNKNSWDALLGNQDISLEIEGEKVYPDDVMNELENVVTQLESDVGSYDAQSQQSVEAVADGTYSAVLLLRYIKSFDERTMSNREEQFARYFGDPKDNADSILQDFCKFFNEHYKNADLAKLLTIEDCRDIANIETFMEQALDRFRKSRGSTEVPDYAVKLIKEFMKTLGSSVPAENSKVFIDMIDSVLFEGRTSNGGHQDNMVALMSKAGDGDIDSIFAEAEKAGGDDWMKKYLKYLPIQIDDPQLAIDEMKTRMAGVKSPSQSGGKRSRTRIL